MAGTRMAATETKTFSWNPTVGSYVLYCIQQKQKAGLRTGVVRFTRQFIVTEAEVGWKCKITATDRGFEFIAACIKDVLAMDDLGITSASTFRVDQPGTVR